MIASTWDDWFVTKELEAVEPKGLSVWYLGGNGFVLRSPDTTIYLDPYFGRGNPPTQIRMDPIPMNPADATLCDAVLITHEHFDHMHPPSYRPLVEDLGARVYAPKTAYETVGDERPPVERSTAVAVGDTFAIGDVTVHVREANDPDADEPVSYVFEHRSGTFFHGGDTRPSEAFEALGREFDLDVGVLAFGSVGRRYYPDRDVVETRHVYMDENQVLEAANALSLDRLVPTHYNMWKGLDADPKGLHEHATSFAYPHVIEVMRVGDRIDLDRPGIVPLDCLGE